MPTTKEQREARIAAAGTANRIFTFDTLPEKGITLHRNYIRRLVKARKFPAPFYLSERRPAWTELALDQFIAEREAERDADIGAKRR